MPLPLLEEARSLQDDEAMLLECVYGGAGSNGDGGDEGRSSDRDFRIIRSVDDGRPQRVECVVMRECPTAVIFSSAERRRYANGGGELPPLRHGATSADIIWAAPTNDGEEANAREEPSSSRGGGGAAASLQSVPVGYKCQRPLRVTLTLTIPPLYPFSPLRHWRLDANQLSSDDLQRVSRSVGALVSDLTGGGGGVVGCGKEEGEGGEGVGGGSSEGADAAPTADGTPMLQIFIETARGALESLQQQTADETMAAATTKVQQSSAKRTGGGDGGGGADDDDDDDDDDFDEDAQLLLYQHRPIDTSVLGRRCVYFHHILSRHKRCVIMNMARLLDLRGFCKIGYPGVLIVEGAEGACEFYVQTLQRLRWKLMVVRGEEKEDAPGGYQLHRVITSRNLRGVFGGTPPANAQPPAAAAQSSATAKKKGAGKQSSSGGGKGSRQTQPSNSNGDDSDGFCGYDEDGNRRLSPSAEANAAATRRAEAHLASRPILETGSAEEIAGWAGACGLSALFRTVMKIYN